MRIVKQRFYGEPKLVKPKFCNNKNLLGSVEWNKHCRCKLWAYGDKYYLLHRDWFSNFLSFSEAKKRGIIDSITYREYANAKKQLKKVEERQGIKDTYVRK